MTALGKEASRRPLGRRVTWWRGSPALAPSLLAVAAAMAFLIVQPPVGDLWAARARQSAAAHGVGLTYWFSWFGGGATPGTYSVLTPYLSAIVGAALLGAIATVAITPLCWRLVHGSRYPLAATWTATVVAGLNLWSGRIPFAVGTALSVGAFLAVRGGRPRWAAALTVLAVLASPVSGAFIALGLLGPLLVNGAYRRVSATTILAAALGLGALAAMYGTPGPQGFRVNDAVLVAVGLLALLVARPPPYLAVVVLLALAACPLLVAIPNGMGSNFQRMAWICLPVAVVATAGIRLPLAMAAAGIAVISGARQTISDVRLAQRETSSAAYYAPLAQRLDTLPGLSSYRVEVVADGTHTASYALLEHAALARGYETQADNALNAVLSSPTELTPTSYQRWLADNAVGYVALPAMAVHPNPEYALVSSGGLPYLNTVWSDDDWTLLRVRDPRPIVTAPASMRDADQADIAIEVPRHGAVLIRVRFSRFLRVDGPEDGSGASLSGSVDGWTVLTVTQPGEYRLHGSATGLGA